MQPSGCGGGSRVPRIHPPWSRSGCGLQWWFPEVPVLPDPPNTRTTHAHEHTHMHTRTKKKEKRKCSSCPQPSQWCGALASCINPRLVHLGCFQDVPVLRLMHPCCLHRGSPGTLWRTALHGSHFWKGKGPRRPHMFTLSKHVQWARKDENRSHFKLNSQPQALYFLGSDPHLIVISNQGFLCDFF